MSMCNRPIVPETAIQTLLDVEGQAPEMTQFLMDARRALLKQSEGPASEKNRDDARKS
tara:strand:+ start:518 stop:691 length:174 start_codon:yes stop_codon:yes gene_type:complete